MSRPAGWLHKIGMFRSTCPGRPFLTFPDLDAIARKTGLVIRGSARFTPADFLQTLVGSVVTGLASLKQLAGSLKGFTNSAMARQWLHGRFSARSTAFLINPKPVVRHFGINPCNLSDQFPQNNLAAEVGLRRWRFIRTMTIYLLRSDSFAS